MPSQVPDLVEARELVGTYAPALYVMEERLRLAGDPVEQGIILALDDARAYYVTQELERFDRELRRTTARARRGTLPLQEALAESLTASLRELRVPVPSYESGRRPVPYEQRPHELRGSLHGVRPDAPVSSSLRLVASEPGSSLMLLAPLGALVTLMVSEPMTAIANAAAWSGSISRVRSWLRRSKDPLDGVSGRQLLSVLAEFGGDPQAVLGQADQVVNLVDGPEVHLPNGTVLKSPRRILVFNKYEDGSTSIFELE